MSSRVKSFIDTAAVCEEAILRSKKIDMTHDIFYEFKQGSEFGHGRFWKRYVLREKGHQAKSI